MKKTIIIITVLILAILLMGFIILGYFTLDNNPKVEQTSECLFYAPVCSLDNTTYNNSCSAEEAGVTVYTEGECEDKNITTNELTDEKLGNTIYYSPAVDQYMEFINGEYGDQENNITASISNSAYGDLTNDNIVDAVVVTTISNGDKIFTEIHVALNDYGTPVCFANETLGENIEINNISIEDGIISINNGEIEYEFKNFQLTKKED
jgi:DNA polymerase III epsilon subunit-like protein